MDTALASVIETALRDFQLAYCSEENDAYPPMHEAVNVLYRWFAVQLHVVERADERIGEADDAIVEAGISPRDLAIIRWAYEGRLLLKRAIRILVKEAERRYVELEEEHGPAREEYLATRRYEIP